MEIVDIDGVDGFRVMYKPYVYSVMIPCSKHFIILNTNGGVKVIEKHNWGDKNERSKSNRTISS